MEAEGAHWWQVEKRRMRNEGTGSSGCVVVCGVRWNIEAPTGLFRAVFPPLLL